MNTQSSAAFDPQIFKPSKNSHLAKAIKWIWFSAAISVGFLVVTNKGPLTVLLIVVGLLLLFMGALHLMLRSQLNAKRTLVTINAEEISCLAFAGPIKKYVFSQVSNASIEVVGGSPVLQLQLNAGSGIADKKSFINGRNPVRPFFPLAPYSAEDQEKILDAIHLRLTSRGFDRATNATVNALRVEREFQEKLKAGIPITWVTYALVAANIAIWGVMVATGADALKPSPELLFRYGGNTTFAVQSGQWWRLLSATFLHAGIVHLIVNMFGLVMVGMTLERLFGHKLYLVIYLISGIMGSALSMHYSAQKAVSVGASGAIFGIAGALLVAVFKNRKTVPKMFGKKTLSGMGFFVIYSLIQGFGRTGTDNAAHVGGLLAGCLMAALLASRSNGELSTPRSRWRTPVALLIAALLTPSLALTSVTSDFDVQRAIDGYAAFAESMRSLTAAEVALQQEQRDVKAGKLTEREADNRSRTAHAPAYRAISDQLSSAWFLPGDTRNEILKEIKYSVMLMTEALAMESTFPEGTTKAEPADPVRQAFINSELIKVNSRVQVLSQKMAAQKDAVKKQ